MNKLEISINAGIGDNIITRIFCDAIKSRFDEIRISHNRKIVEHFRNGDPAYYDFLNDLGNTLFSEPPYVFDHNQYPSLKIYDMVQGLNIHPQAPNIDHVLCKGTSLDTGGEPYIVITTKIRGMDRHSFYPKSIKLWKVLKQLSSKYKIVILGEREVERNKEYALHPSIIYGIYDQIISNLPLERIIDLTVPSLGITIPNIDKIKQDCLIMKEAKFVITLAVGGNTWLALAVANVIGFKLNSTPESDYVDGMVSCLTNPAFSTAFITFEWEQFISKLGTHK